MNRDIKFRAKDKDGCWRYGNLATGIYKGGWCPVIQEEYEYEYESLPIMESLKEYWIINNKTIGQYTGLKDKNGKEIYEGDVLKQVKKSSREGYESTSYDKNNFEVVFKYGSFWLQRPYGDSAYIRDFPNIDEFVGFECFEIVGNIYENPELLETEL